MSATPSMSPDLRTFIDRVIVPALLERFLRDQATASEPPPPSAARDLPEAEATV